jgi:hypothetical protein
MASYSKGCGCINKFRKGRLVSKADYPVTVPLVNGSNTRLSPKGRSGILYENQIQSLPKEVVFVGVQ